MVEPLGLSPRFMQKQSSYVNLTSRDLKLLDRRQMQKKVLHEDEMINAYREFSPTNEHSPIRSELDKKKVTSRNSLDTDN